MHLLCETSPYFWINLLLLLILLFHCQSMIVQQSMKLQELEAFTLQLHNCYSYEPPCWVFTCSCGEVKTNEPTRDKPTTLWVWFMKTWVHVVWIPFISPNFKPFWGRHPLSLKWFGVSEALGHLSRHLSKDLTCMRVGLFSYIVIELPEGAGDCWTSA